MPEIEVPGVRIVVKGCPSTRSERTNVMRARNMLLRAFEDNHWPGNAMFTVTPGGFVKAPFPDGWDGARGWASRPEDFRSLVPHARSAVDEVLTPRALDAARSRTDFLTLGVDLNDASGKRASSAMTPRSRRHRRSEEMKELARTFAPTMILHHPHSTDWWRVWSTAWSGAREFLPQNEGDEHVQASGVAYCNGRDKCRGALCDVRCRTRCCGDQVVDILVKP